MRETPAMVKVIAFFKRRTGMDLEAFRSYWLTRHPEVVTRLPGLRRYVQSHTLLGGYRKGDPVFDGIAEVWFEDTQALRALAGTAVSQAVAEDEARFIDRASMATIITEEHVIKDGAAPVDGVKSVEFLTRKPGMSVEEFQHYWREVHGPLAAAIPVVRRYVQSHTRRSAYERGRAPAYDGVAITWFDDTQTMRVSATTAEYTRTRADQPNFIDTSRLPVILTKEHVIVA
jgi:uncharacterized protein (TIGR02118 family)